MGKSQLSTYPTLPSVLNEPTNHNTFDTFERLMKAVDPKHLERCLVENGKRFLSSLAEKQVVLDGKKPYGANPTAKGNKGDYLLNAFVSENELLIGQLRTEPLHHQETRLTHGKVIQ